MNQFLGVICTPEVYWALHWLVYFSKSEFLYKKWSEFVVASLCDCHFNFLIANVGFRMRSAVVTVIYRKTLSVNSARLNRNFSVGEIVNFMSTDVDRIVNSCPSFHSLWSIPFQVCYSECIHFPADKPEEKQLNLFDDRHLYVLSPAFSPLETFSHFGSITTNKSLRRNFCSLGFNTGSLYDCLIYGRRFRPPLRIIHNFVFFFGFRAFQLIWCSDDPVWVNKVFIREKKGRNQWWDQFLSI